MRKYTITSLFLFLSALSFSQIKWRNVDSLYQPLPSSIHVYFTSESIDSAAFKAYYIIADLKDKALNFTADTSYKRRLTPAQFYQKENKPLVVINCSFFNFDKNKNLNLVVRNGRLIAYNAASLKNSGKDTTIYKIPFRSAIGIFKDRHADAAWSYTDSSLQYARVSQTVVKPGNSLAVCCERSLQQLNKDKSKEKKWYLNNFKKWKVQTAIGGGPMLLQNGEIFITNEEELMFTGKAFKDKHPRTAIGYTKDDKLVILVVEGRSESGGGATFTQEAQIFKDLGCIEALNLDGGGSSCMLVNGKETIKPSDKEGERPTPAAFIIEFASQKK